MLRLPARSGLVLSLALAWTAVACEDTNDPLGGPLTFSLTGDSVGVAGDTVHVRFDAVGRRLQGVILRWGDGVVDSVPSYGAQTHSAINVHVYETPGTFTVQGRVEDSYEGALEEQHVIRIQ